MKATGSKARLEKSGIALLRSIVKFACHGHGACEKGAGLHVKDFFKEKFPEMAEQCVGRVELADRQDWSFECVSKVYPMLDGFNDFLIESLVLDPNVLLDSTLQRTELIQFEACMHTAPIAWLRAWAGLRAITNSNAFRLNPMEMHVVHGHLWKMGTLLMGPDSLSVLDDDYRPWPKLQPDNEQATSYYADSTKTGRTSRGGLRNCAEGGALPPGERHSRVLVAHHGRML